MNTIELCTGFSVAAVIGSAVYAVFFSKRKRLNSNYLSPLHIITIGVFVSVLMIHIPVYFQWYKYEDDYAFLRPVWLTIINSFRVFLLDINYDDLKQTAASSATWIHVFYLFWAAFLYLLAPILTFTNVLSLFKNAVGTIKIILCFHKRIIIFSEINPRSVHLAKSVLRQSVRNTLVVFADKRDPEAISCYGLLDCRELRKAVVLKKSIDAINLKKSSCYLELFLVNEDEFSCIKDFVNVNDKNREYKNRTADKGNNLISEKLLEEIKYDPINFITHPHICNFVRNADFRKNELCYLVQRIDVFSKLAINTLTNKSFICSLLKDTENDKIISFTVIGLENLGKEFLKTALWIFQIYDYKLQINLIDSQNNDKLLKSLETEMPDIVAEKNKASAESPLSYGIQKDGDSNFCINLFGGIDFHSSDFDELLTSETTRQFFFRSRVFLVVSDDDKQNCEIAIRLPQLIERMMIFQRSITPERDCLFPNLYVSIYDDILAAGFSHEANLSLFGNDFARNKSIQIQVIGRESELYQYTTLLEWKKLQTDAMKTYFEWISVAKALRDLYQKEQNDNNSQFSRLYKELMDIHFKKIKIWFGDEFLYDNNSGLINYQYIERLAIEYYTKEYYCNSSISKLIHNCMALTYFDSYYDSLIMPEKRHEETVVCMCESCRAKRKSEHMRWLNYMRVSGYIYSDIHSRSAKTHNDLCTWEELSPLARYFSTMLY